MQSSEENHWGVVGAAYDTMAESEEARLRTSRDSLEFQFAKRLITPYLLGVRKVIDVGSGPGAYALWLAKRGVLVKLIDVSERSLRLAEFLAARGKIDQFVTTRHGHAADLKSEGPEIFDLVLLLGPIYHAPNRQYVIRVLEEVRRVLVGHGVLVVNVVNAFYMLSSLCATEAPKVVEALLDEVRQKGNASYRGTTTDTGVWMCSRQHMQLTLEDEGFNVVECRGSKGILQGRESLLSPKLKTEPGPLVDLMIRSASVPEYISQSQYVWFVARKND